MDHSTSFDSIQPITWEKARSQVTKTNPTLATIIDKLSPGKNLSFIKAQYAFGEYILKDGLLQSPKNTSETHRNLFKEKLSYSKIPLMLTLHNSNEVFLDIKSRIIPLNLFKEGSLLGLFESMDYLFNYVATPKWSVSAGARSIFTLPKINEVGGFKKLRLKYGLPSGMRLRSIDDHWYLFTAMAKHAHFESTWQNEVLFFTKEWLTKRNKDPMWVEFHHYLFEQSWKQAQFAIGKIELNLIWETFIDAVASRRLKPSPYLADQVKHIMLIAAGKWPGFRPADYSDHAAPVTTLQKALIEVYGLEQHAPTIMQPYLLNAEEKLPAYYSLTFPTLLEGSPHNKHSSTMMLDLKDIKLLLSILENSLEKSGYKNALLGKPQFDFFHVENDAYGDIHSSKMIPELDPALKKNVEASPAGTFCATSPFWRGSILIDPFSKN